MTEMTDRQRSPDKTPAAHPGLPRWVKLLALGTVVVVAVLIVAMLLIGGEHRPGMHNA